MAFLPDGSELPGPTAERPTTTVTVSTVDVRPTQLRRVLADLCADLGYRCYVPTTRRLLPLPPHRLATVDLQRRYRTNDPVLTARHTLPAGEPA